MIVYAFVFVVWCVSVNMCACPCVCAVCLCTVLGVYMFGAFVDVFVRICLSVVSVLCVCMFVCL